MRMVKLGALAIVFMIIWAVLISLILYPMNYSTDTKGIMSVLMGFPGGVIVYYIIELKWGWFK